MPERSKARPLPTFHFIWIIDCSGSMGGARIAAINRGIRACTAPMSRAAGELGGADVRVRAVTFGDGARWHIAEPTALANIQWNDVRAEGLTDMGAALALTAEAEPFASPSDAAPPTALALISDGLPTDDFARGFGFLMSRPAATRSVRVAVAIGSDIDMEILKVFVGTGGMEPVGADIDDLEAKIQWAGTYPLKHAAAAAGMLRPVPTDRPVSPP